MDITNLFANLKPSFGPFAPVLDNPITILLALAWAVGFVIMGFRLVEALVRMGKAKAANIPDVYDDAKSGLGWPVGAIIALSALPILWTVLVGI